MIRLLCVMSAIIVFGWQASALRAAVLAQDGRSDYVVVVPDGATEPEQAAASMLVKHVQAMTGAALPIVPESEAAAGARRINIGATRAAQAAGLRVDQLTGMSCLLRAINGDLYLAGNDRAILASGKQAPGPRHPSRKAVLLFLRDVAGVKWLVPNTQGHGVHYPAGQRVEFPDALNVRWDPPFDFTFVYAFGHDEGWNLNSIPHSHVAHYSYGGHSHTAAVPLDKHGAQHPEYFALVRGERGKTPHLALDRPDVRQMIYDEMLRRIDAGYESVQLGQTDGYQPDESPAARAIHANPGERLWIVHNELAQRLANDRPQAKVVILAYDITRTPPQTINRLGSNVVVEIANPDRWILEAWRPKADRFHVYLYNWGAYHKLGFAPKSTPGMIAQQTRYLHQQGVRGIYCCGSGESWALEGPVYYIFNLALDNPNLDWPKALDDYYRASFGKAYKPMKRLFDELYGYLEFMGSRQAWALAAPAEPNIKYGSFAGSVNDWWSAFFPPALLLHMDACLTEAKALEPQGAVAQRIAHVERGVFYVKDLATVVALYRAYQASPSLDLLDRIEQGTRSRIARLEQWHQQTAGTWSIDGFPAMFKVDAAVTTLTHVARGGESKAVLDKPFFNFDAAAERARLSGSKP